MNTFVVVLKPKTLFLIDSAGALVTAFFLFVILRTFDTYFGMPSATLTLLSVLALVFCAYSISCFFFVGSNWRPFLRAISMANLLYCCLTIALVISHYHSLTILGIGYFLVEVIVVCGVVFVEWRTLRNSNVHA